MLQNIVSMKTICYIFPSYVISKLTSHLYDWLRLCLTYNWNELGTWGDQQQYVIWQTNKDVRITGLPIMIRIKGGMLNEIYQHWIVHL